MASMTISSRGPTCSLQPSGRIVGNVEGPAMLTADKRYNLFSGAGHVPPECGLGFWCRPESRATQESALALAHEFRERKIPCDVIGLEAGWQTHAYPCTFVWNKEPFPGRWRER